MARKRLIDPEFWLDEEVSRISDRAKLLYIGMWNFADDSGVLEDMPEKIRVQVFPYDPKTEVKILLKELKDIKKLKFYKVGGKKYILIKNFSKYQKGIHYPSKRYPLPQSSPSTPTVLPQHSPRSVEKSRVEKSRVEYDKNSSSNNAYKKLKEKFGINI